MISTSILWIHISRQICKGTSHDHIRKTLVSYGRAAKLRLGKIFISNAHHLFSRISMKYYYKIFGTKIGFVYKNIIVAVLVTKNI